MKTIGEAMQGAGVGTPRPVVSDEPRLHRVHLCTMIFATHEVTARTPEEAFDLAQRQAAQAKPDFSTVPFSIRADVRRLVDPRDETKGFQWVRLEQVESEHGVRYWAQGKVCPE